MATTNYREKLKFLIDREKEIEKELKKRHAFEIQEAENIRKKMDKNFIIFNERPEEIPHNLSFWGLLVVFAMILWLLITFSLYWLI